MAKQTSYLYRKKSKDDEVVTVAKSLIKTWKKFVPESQEKKDKKKEERKAEESEKEQNKEIGGKSFPARYDIGPRGRPKVTAGSDH